MRAFIILAATMILGCGAQTPESPPAELTPPPVSSIESQEGTANPGAISALVVLIYAQDGTFLGQVDSNQFNTDSICNRFGSYGNQFSPTSIRNNLSKYGSAIGIYSAYNSITQSPPVLFSYDGTTLTPLYYLTTNTLKTPLIDPNSLIAYFCGP